MYANAYRHLLASRARPRHLGTAAHPGDHPRSSSEITTTEFSAVPADCDGQILVSHDMLGLSTGPVPSFVRHYAQLGESVIQAVEQYVADVKASRFPQPPAPASKPEDALK